MKSLQPYLLGALILGACAAPEPEVAPAADPPPAAATEPDVRGEEVAYEVDGVQLNGYLAYDAAAEGPRPGVLVVHEWWGHNEYARTRARMLAEMGYTALAVDMYGDGKFAEHPEDAMKFMTEVAENLDAGVARFSAARALLDEHATTDGRAAAIGYCFGGAMVLHMARIGQDLAGVASFHGDLVARAEVEAGGISARVLVLNGADDPFVSVESVEAFKTEMDAVEADWQFIDYPGAVHSFTNPGATAIGEQFEMPLAYQREADEQSWAELERFLTASFGG